MGDLFFEEFGQHKIAARLKKGLPPQFQEEGPDGQPPIPPEAQQQMDEMKAMLDQMSQELEQAKAALAAQTAKSQADLQIAGVKADADTAAKSADIASKERIALEQAAVDREALRSRELIAQLQIEQKNQALAIEAKLEELKMLFQAKQADKAADRQDEARLHGAIREDRHREEDRSQPEGA